MTDMPERINVIKTITYNVGQLRREVMNDFGIELATVDDVMEYIEGWVADDFGGLSGLVFQDENGTEL
jgi:hypothetical protein